MPKLINEIAYCRRMEKKCYMAGDYFAGRYYSDEIRELIQNAVDEEAITPYEAIKIAQNYQ